MPSASTIIFVFFSWWFLWVPFLLGLMFWDVWVRYIRTLYQAELKWSLFEIKVPRDIAKSPKAMESILAGIHGSKRTGDLIRRYWEGFQTASFSLEITGDETGVHFYIRAQSFFKKLIESQVYAQYPAVEISEVEDYTDKVPTRIPNEEWDAWGSEMVLTKPDAYPIRTYEDFPLEDISVKEEERKIDPLASMVEFMGNFNEGEKLWLQILIRPAGEEWKKEGEKMAAEKLGRKTETKAPPLGRLVSGIENAVLAILGVASAEPKKEERPMFGLFLLSPGEQEVVKAVEKNIAKLGFEVGMRWIYLAKHDRFNFVAVPSTFGILKQFNSQSLNGLAPNMKTITTVDYWFVNTRVRMRKARLFNAYKLRSYFYHPYKAYRPFVFSTSELATVFHFPGTVAGAPAMERVGAKKGAAPPNLPI